MPRRQRKTGPRPAQRTRRVNESEHRLVSPLRHTHTIKWIKGSDVAAPLKPFVAARRKEIREIIEDLGGEGEVTAMQRGLLDGYFKSAVCVDSEFYRFAATQDPEALLHINKYIATCTKILTTLGLNRRAKQVPSLNDYVKTVDTSAVEEKAE